MGFMFHCAEPAPNDRASRTAGTGLAEVVPVDRALGVLQTVTGRFQLVKFCPLSSVRTSKTEPAVEVSESLIRPLVRQITDDMINQEET
jgi:hypothetical protein